MHPTAWVFDDDDVTDLRVRYPYFPHAEPIAFPVRGSYADTTARVETTTEYSWAHSLEEVFTSLLDAGLAIELFRERPHTFFPPVPFLVERTPGEWWLPEGTEGEIPLSYSLRARKPAA